MDPTLVFAGQSLDGTQMSIEEAFIQGTSNVAKTKHGVGRNQITHFFVPYNKFAQLLNNSSSKQYVDVASKERCGNSN